MTRISKSVTILIIIIVLIGFIGIFVLLKFNFGPGVQDFSKNLTGNYQVYRMSENNVFIAPKDVWSSEDAIIPEKVVRLNEYKNFIIAERQGLKRRSSEDSNDTYLIVDSNILDYWILDTKKKFVIEKLNKQQFEIKLDSLGIPGKTELINVYNY